MPTLVKREDRFRAIKGPLAATIATIHEAGWKPAGAAHWRVDEQTIAHVGGAAFAKTHILAKLQDDIARQLAIRANEHSHGCGMGADICLDAARRAKHLLVKAGEYKAAAALDYIVTGVYGDSSEKKADGTHEAEQVACCRCGVKPRDLRFHELLGVLRQSGDRRRGGTRQRKSKDVIQGGRSGMEGAGVLVGSWYHSGTVEARCAKGHLR